MSEGETAYKKQLPLPRGLLGHGTDPEYQDSLAAGHINLGNLYHTTGRAKEAEAAYKGALAIRKILAEKHPRPEYQNDLADSHRNLGLLYQAKAGTRKRKRPTRKPSPSENSGGKAFRGA